MEYMVYIYMSGFGGTRFVSEAVDTTSFAVEYCKHWLWDDCTKCKGTENQVFTQI